MRSAARARARKGSAPLPSWQYLYGLCRRRMRRVRFAGFRAAWETPAYCLRQWRVVAARCARDEGATARRGAATLRARTECSYDCAPVRVCSEAGARARAGAGLGLARALEEERAWRAPQLRAVAAAPRVTAGGAVDLGASAPLLPFALCPGRAQRAAACVPWWTLSRACELAIVTPRGAKQRAWRPVQEERCTSGKAQFHRLCVWPLRGRSSSEAGVER